MLEAVVNRMIPAVGGNTFGEMEAEGDGFTLRH